MANKKFFFASFQTPSLSGKHSTKFTCTSDAFDIAYSEERGMKFKISNYELHQSDKIFESLTSLVFRFSKSKNFPQ